MRPTLGRTFLVVLVTLATVGLAQKSPAQADSQEAVAAELSTDLQAIRSGAEAFVEAFNRKDAKAVAALWTEDGEYIDESGRSFQGRAQIEQAYADSFTKHPHVTMRIAIDALRQLSSHTAIEDGMAVVEEGTSDEVPLLARYTAVHVKVDGKWLMASVRETSLQVSFGQQSIRDLEFLIGSWVAEEYGNTVEFSCRWVANESFIERAYTTTFRDGSHTTGLQLIGWNPIVGRVQSWDFSPGGGHAVGIWTPVENGWISETEGYTGDGSRTTSVNLLRRLDDNAYVWQSTQRTIGGTASPDTDEVILRRQEAK